MKYHPNIGIIHVNTIISHVDIHLIEFGNAQAFWHVNKVDL